MKILKSYAVALSGLMAIILVFGITLTQGASQERKKSDQEISDLKAEIVLLSDRLADLEESNYDKSKKISQLQKTLSQIQEEGNILEPADLLYPAISPKETKITPKISSSKPTPKKYYTNLEIAGFATYKIEYQKGQTALGQLLKSAKKNDFEVKYTSYDFGVFVDCIGGICGDTNHFWSLYENGEMSMVGAADLVLEINDKITWVYTSF